MPSETIIGALTVYLKANMRQFATSMQKAQMAVKTFGTKAQAMLKAAGARMLTYFKYALPIALAASIRSIAKFQQNISMVNTMLSKQTAHYLPGYSKKIRRLAVQYGESTATLSKGLYDILSASVDASKATDVLTVAVQSAAAGFTDTSVSADAITTILNAYNMEAEDAIKISDILFATVKKGKITYAELASSIGVVASVASTANLSLEQVSAAIATMTRAGLRSDIAITALRQIILAFLKPTDEAKEAAAEFGLVLDANTLSALGLTGVMQKLSTATAEQIARIIPSARALTGFAAALKQSKEMAEDYQFMLNSAGQTEEAFKKATDNLYHSLKRLWAMIKDIGLGIGGLFADPLKAAIDELVLAYDMIKDAIEAARKGEGKGRLPGLPPEEFWATKTPEQVAADRVMSFTEELKKQRQTRAEETATGLGALMGIPPGGAAGVNSGRTGWFGQRLFDSMDAGVKKASASMITGTRIAKKWFDQSIEATKRYVENLQRIAQRWQWLTDQMTFTMTNAFDRLVFEGEKFGDFMKNLLRNIARDIANIMIFEPFARTLAGGITGLMGAPVAHRGGMIGSGMPQMQVPALAFAGAPRLHGGLRDDEFPAVLQRGERVYEKGGGPDVQLNIINQTSQPVEAEQPHVRLDGDALVADVIIRDANTNGPITSALRSRIGG